MPDSSSGFTGGGPADRLAMLRGAGVSRQQTSGDANRRMRIELWIGIVLVLGGVAFAVSTRGGTATTPAPPAASAVASDAVAPTSEDSQLLDGEAVVSFAVEYGNFPPSLGVGDLVRIIVTPSNDGTGDVRPLGERTVVVSVDQPADMSTTKVVSVRGPESIATAVAASGPVHVAIVKVGNS